LDPPPPSTGWRDVGERAGTVGLLAAWTGVA
jgi:hypothetical protein